MIKICLSAAAIILLASSCSPTKGQYYPVNNNAPRVSSLGFSISPPPGGDWYEKHLEDTLYYFKRTKGNSYALTTQATELIFANESDHKLELLEYVRKHKIHPDSGSRYRNSSFDYSYERIASGLCIRYKERYDDHGNEKKGPHPYVQVFSKGLVCRHPLSPKTGIALQYMEQSFPTTHPISFRDEGEKFISSLNFFTASSY
jgi:hypothetical protein